MKVSVSYLKNKNGKKEAIEELEKSSCDFIHVDLTDGVFAGERNYEIDEVLSLFQMARKSLDMHLMVQSPEKEIEAFAILNPAFITIPIEIENVKKYIEKIHGLGIKCGLAINPDTPLAALDDYFDCVDLVLLMSVTPGYGGQKFLESTKNKLEKLIKLKKENNSNFLISVDGGINDETISMVRDLVDIAVSGSYICLSSEIEKNLKVLRG